MTRARWIHGPVIDTVVAFCWIPFVLAGRSLEADPDKLATLVVATFLLSFAHQPLTLALVYGDPDQFQARRSLFTWSPVVFLAAVLGGMTLSLAAVAIVAGLWNAEHTLMQRYGVTRIYGRKAGHDDGRLERALLLSFLGLALVWVAADSHTPTRIERIRLGAVNTQALHVLTGLRPVAMLLLVPAVATAIGLGVAWLRAEQAQGAAANRAKHVYMASTAALFAVILVDPIAGFLGYVGAHAVEYGVIVMHSLAARGTDDRRGPLGLVVQRRGGRWWFLGGYIAMVLLLVAGLKHSGNRNAYEFAVLFLGGLHVFYDGFIWKLRRPKVAQRFELTTV
jgi:hypothetical protein